MTDPRGYPLLDPLPVREALRRVWRNTHPGQPRGYQTTELYQLNCLCNQAHRDREARAAAGRPLPGTTAGGRASW